MEHHLSDLEQARRAGAETWAGKRPVEGASYPYFNPPRELPFPCLGAEPQLFLDNYVVDHLVGVRRRIVPPQKANPALLRYEDLPWERYHNTMLPLAALQDPDSGRYRMWYKTLLSGNTNSAAGTTVALCYAESGDGLTWVKPRLPDSVPFAGERRTNILLDDFDNGTVVLNHDRSDPNRKYLAVANPIAEAHRRGQRTMSRAYASPDGIRWTVISDDTPFRHHHQPRVIRDDAIGRWVAWSQYSHAWSHDHERKIGRQESEDFIRWSPKEVALSAQWDPNLEPGVELHTMSVRKAGGLYVGIVEEAHGEFQWLRTGNGANQRDQFHTKAALYCSRDGRHFTRADGYRPWADNDAHGGQYYGYLAHSVAGALYAGGKLIIPCSANPHKQRDTRPAGAAAHVPAAAAQEAQRHVDELTAHGGGNPMMDTVKPNGALQRSIGALVLREDGWAALEPIYEQGDVYTVQFVFTGERLLINAQCDYGVIRAAVLDSELKPVPGFSLAECAPVHGPADRIWHEVRWGSGAPLRRLRERPVRLQFRLLEAALYAFRFAARDGSP